MISPFLGGSLGQQSFFGGAKIEKEYGEGAERLILWCVRLWIHVEY